MTDTKPLPSGFEDLEISTQIIIRDALTRGITIEMVDRKENFLRLIQGNHSEFVKEASKTRLDSLMTYLVMENKIASKLVLEENGIRVPVGRNYSNLETALADYTFFLDKKKVIKPVTTNFGLGIGISEPGDSLDKFTSFVNIALGLSNSIIIEEFIEGPEYRFLVLGDEVIAVCNRVPANVTGDGKSSIRDLILKKNEDPRRGEGHKTALEKIQMSEVELQILKDQGLNFESVPDLGKQVFIRKNSNISTGGDSLDVTDNVHPDFKTIAVSAAKAAGAVICGIDIISSQIESKPNVKTYAILEINFNPVLYIHEFPYSGKPRFVGNKILDLLGFQ
ncbi:bifunctional glutamate--cysteine ligase GshA/glutathione synthetase GshB [Leptospira congkakensis]|uniref:Bifunctional glutamate--cysteine ligase GshA/glutathione synthetase GshB n=1 Tax=Leptospira congkakensis TaxID=2484932 RepID=A0A4Z1AGX6_9LEPT|nr:bifunctional glutamate--cysteine ligase GshA/glutathione synthetase GshB [Leptospira congkakensis]TGL90329.1 bifunctional glutamate--cysteine ligase GshA/glutathione synthetase GshB [Leptospira congkakensis]TGL91336.1 bifunctional glutamate--cysteine ligase GshA/glutathione synthetase GshB [Leptospira congkakensis]TGL98388.1 bifunctional glutamate--cysteine ligase GshA/glutathione synthetase GshB [Leptospira congkakensis]